jgi:alpha-L-rhamnosidase
MNEFKPGTLKCDYMTEPIGIDNPNPLLSWTIESKSRGVMQVAYRIMASRTEEGLRAGKFDLWDSGMVKSDESFGIAYGGKPLATGERCWFKVAVRSTLDEMPVESDPSFFEAGIMMLQDWKASFIGLPVQFNQKPKWVHETTGAPLPLLRKDTAIDKKIKKACAYVSALGLYEFHINGVKVGDRHFAPGWTDYNKRLQYDTYDVTGLLHIGENTLAAIIADGWYAGKVANYKRFSYGPYPLGFFMQINLTYEDGTKGVITTGKGWKASTGPFIYGDILNGEYYDANLEKNGWDKPDYNDKGWHRAVVLERGTETLVAHIGPPVRKTLEIKPIGISRTAASFIYDMGQNMVGHVSFKMKGPAGTRITLKYGEMLNRDGSLYTDNLRSAMATDTYVKRTDKAEEFAPRFTFHGFRYCEVIGLSYQPALDDIKGNVIHSDLPVDGHFECSNPLVNKLYSNIMWGQRGNFLSIPTDCPQRDERLGWTGDAQIFVRTACLNMDAAAFFLKWMNDLDESQQADGAFPHIAPYLPLTGVGSAAWGDAGVIVPWTIYRSYGDIGIIRRHYEAMKKWIAYMESKSTGYIRENKGYGDWLSVDADTPKDVLATAFFAYSTDLLSRMAAIIGEKDDAEKYSGLFENIRTAFNEKYVSDDGKITGETQTCYLLGIHMNLLSAENKKKAVGYLVADIIRHGTHITTGFVGISYLLPILTEYGYNDIAYKLLQNETYPSWGYSIKNGATTIWERWNSYTIENGFADVRMNSFNHYSFGSVGEWMFRYMAGIEIDDASPGYRHLILQPNPGPGIDWLKCGYRSIKGDIVSNWKRTAGGKILYDIIVPANVTARITLQTPNGSPAKLGEGASPVSYGDGKTVVDLLPGKYSFEV